MSEAEILEIDKIALLYDQTPDAPSTPEQDAYLTAFTDYYAEKKMVSQTFLAKHSMDSARMTRMNLVEEQWRYFEDCLHDTPPVAEIEIINDSQTRVMLEKIFSHDTPVVLDYGCGRLRLLHALLAKAPEKMWRYIGIDIVDTAKTYEEDYATCANIISHRDRWEVLRLDTFRNRRDKSGTIGILANVVHELPLISIAEAIEDLRRHLTEDGSLLLIDMGYIPDGEPRFVPITARDIPILLPMAKDESFKTTKGIPVVVATCAKPDLPCFYDRVTALWNWMALKRDALAVIAVEHDAAYDYDHLHAMGLTGRDKTFNFLYLNMVVANATYRLAESAHFQLRNQDVDRAGRDILRIICDCANNTEVTLPTVMELFDQFGAKYPYIVIDAVLKLIGPLSPSALVMYPGLLKGELVPTLAMDFFIDGDYINRRGSLIRVLNDAANDLDDFYK